MTGIGLSESTRADLLKDEIRNVRMSASRALFMAGEELPSEEHAKELEEFFEFHTDRPLTLMILAQSAQRKGDAKDTYKYVKRAIALDKENPEIYRQSAILLSGVGLNERASELLYQGKELAPEDSVFPYSIGLLAAEMGDLDGAIEGLQETVRMDPKFARAWYNLSLAFQQQGRAQEAQQAMMRVRALQQENP